MLFNDSVNEHRGIILPSVFTINCAYTQSFSTMGRPCVTATTRNFQLSSGNEILQAVSMNSIAGVYYDSSATVHNIHDNDGQEVNVYTYGTSTPDWNDDVLGFGNKVDRVMTNTSFSRTGSPVDVNPGGKFYVHNGHNANR